MSSGFIQKRKYNKGYHIEWLANKGNSHSSYSRKEKLLAKEKPIIHQQSSILNIDSNIISKSIIPQKKDEKLVASIDNGASLIYQTNPLIFMNQDTLVRHYLNPESKDNKVKDTTVVGFTFSLLGLICAILGVMGFFGKYLNIGSAAPFFLIIGAILFSIIGLFTCLSAKNMIIKNPSEFKWEQLADLGFVLGLLVPIGFVLLILYGLLLLSAMH